MPQLSWAYNVYTTDRSGKRTDLGPTFFFSWAGADEIEANHSATVNLASGVEIALAPGDYFRTGAHAIDEKDGKLTLVSSGAD